MEESLTRERLGPNGEGVDVFCSRRYGGAEAVETPGDGQRLITFFIFCYFLLMQACFFCRCRQHGSVPESLLIKDRDRQDKLSVLDTTRGLCVTLAPV